MRVALTAHAAIALASLATCAGSGRAQSRARVHAAAAVGELGFAAPAEAYAAIVGVHRRRGVRPERYSAAMRRPPASRRWVPGLVHATATRPPAHWPEALPWRGRYGPRWAAIVRTVRTALRAPIEALPCPGAVHYGGSMDAAPSGHEEVCRWPIGRGWQAFYRRAGGGES